jgi:hypothetical protein
MAESGQTSPVMLFLSRTRAGVLPEPAAGRQGEGVGGGKRRLLPTGAPLSCRAGRAAGDRPNRSVSGGAELQVGQGEQNRRIFRP